MYVIVKNANEVLAVEEDESTARTLLITLALEERARAPGGALSVCLMTHAQLCATEEGRAVWNKFSADN